MTAADRAWLGARIGAGVGLLCLGIGAIRLVYALRFFGMPYSDPERGELLKTALLLGGYWAAFVIAGAAFGIFAPLRRSGLGAFVLGYFAAGIVCGAIGLVMLGLDDRSDPSSTLQAVGATTFIFGSLLGYNLFKDRHSD
jgi:hypothetical protein